MASPPRVPFAHSFLQRVLYFFKAFWLSELVSKRRCWLLQGVDCFGAFMQSGLPKEVLKAVWDLVAGDAGHLSRHQFVQVRRSLVGSYAWRRGLDRSCSHRACRPGSAQQCPGQGMVGRVGGG